MTRRLPAPPPPGSEPPRSPDAPVDPADDDDRPEDDAWDDGLDGADELRLLDADAWPDDADEPTVPEGLLDAVTDIDALPDLDARDEDEDDVVGAPLEDVPLEDDLTDLNAPDDLDLPVLPWSLDVDVDGVRTPAHLDPGADQSLLRSPGATSGRRTVVLVIVGTIVRVEVRVEPGEPGLMLGRDVLAGHFLLRP